VLADITQTDKFSNESKLTCSCKVTYTVNRMFKRYHQKMFFILFEFFYSVITQYI